MDSARTEGGRGLVDHADPEFVWDVKALAVAMHVTGQVGQCLRRKKQTVDFPQIRDTLLGGMNHAIRVHGERFHTNFERKPEQRYLLVRAAPSPDVLVALHKPEKRSNHLAEDAGEVRHRILSIVNLGPEIRLPYAEPFGNRGVRHPDVDSEARD